MADQKHQSTEERDAELVNQAGELLRQNKLEGAMKLLLDVASRTPNPYVREFQADGKRFIRFWDMEEFMHYVTAEKENIKGEIIWLQSAYPKALYYIGFCCVKANDPSNAIKFLDAGFKIEQHPMFLIEKGKALSMMQKHEEALACYEAAFNHPGVVKATLRAVALRGKGVQLIDLNRLDDAEEAFRKSLELDPNNPVAEHELKYIAQLRRGGQVAPIQTVASGGQDALTCVICGKRLEQGGKVHNIDGRLVVRCEECAAKLPATGGSPGLPNRGTGTTLRISGEQRQTKRRKWWRFW
jgi:tetratricopeptide (TPR) repeat protein